jgi:glycogen synthase
MSLHTENQPRRILMTADAVGGVWSYALDLVRHLAPYDIEVTLAVMGPAPGRAQQQEAASIQNLSLTAKPFALEWHPDFSDTELQRSSEWLRSIASSFHSEVVHINGYAHAAGGWNVPRVVVAHSCVNSWWLSMHGELPPASWTSYGRRVTAGLQGAAAVIAPTAWMLRTIERLYGCSSRNSRVIRNFSSQPGQFARKQPFIFSCGRLWDEAKNMQMLDRVAPQLEWPLYMAGSDTGPAGTRVNLQSVYLDGTLSRSEMSNRFSKAAIFTHPAKYEPFGLAVLEAAQHGCALVLADIPPLRELWDGCAVFASPRDSEQWIECLNRLARDSAFREHVSTQCLERSRRYDGSTAAAQYIEVYRGLIRPAERVFTPIQSNEASHQTFLPLHRI